MRKKKEARTREVKGNKQTNLLVMHSDKNLIFSPSVIITCT